MDQKTARQGGDDDGKGFLMKLKFFNPVAAHG
jgi:hypothetical protein